MINIQKIVFIISFCLISSSIYAQSNSLKPELIGTWEFVELLDKTGNKVDTVWHSFGGWEIPKGPLTIYKSDSTYSKQFTPNNIDTGKWYYDNKKKEIQTKSHSYTFIRIRSVYLSSLLSSQS